MRLRIITLACFTLLTLTACAGGGGESPAESTASPSSSGASQTLSATGSPPIAAEIGDETVWESDGFSDFLDCRGPARTDCAIGVMRQNRASAQAISFLRKTGWVLAAFQELGRVDLGTLVDPGRANSVHDFALLNGTPEVVVVEDVGSGLMSGEILTLDPNYPELLAPFPDLITWGADQFFEGTLPSPLGQRFAFQFVLVNGCHACLTGYMARIALGVDSDGTRMADRSSSTCAGRARTWQGTR